MGLATIASARAEVAVGRAARQFGVEPSGHLVVPVPVVTQPASNPVLVSVATPSIGGQSHDEPGPALST